MAGRDVAQRPAQQQGVTDHIASQRQIQRATLRSQGPRRANRKKVNERQATGQRGACPGYKPGRHLRCVHRARGQARHGQGESKNEDSHEAKPQTQVFALLRGVVHGSCALLYRGWTCCLVGIRRGGGCQPALCRMPFKIHKAVATSATDMQRLNISKRRPCASQCRRIEPATA